MNLPPSPSPFAAPLCEECASAQESILRAMNEACDDCFYLLPERLQDLWQKRWAEQDRLEMEWRREM